MKQKKLLTLFLTVATSFSMLVACSNATFAESTGTATVTESTNTTDKKQKADENQDAAKQLLVDLTGSYQELWPVILDRIDYRFRAGKALMKNISRSGLMIVQSWLVRKMRRQHMIS